MFMDGLFRDLSDSHALSQAALDVILLLLQ